MTARKAELPLAIIPFLFGLQQLTEGIIWLSFHNESPLPKATLTFVYSLFSHVLWPIFIPFAVGLLEGVIAWRKKALVACQIAGTAVGIYLFVFHRSIPGDLADSGKPYRLRFSALLRRRCHAVVSDRDLRE